jgi:2-polyprenyl-6-methoxyphenol hydroxylase-like FAD-dependent oxidoreductase
MPQFLSSHCSLLISFQAIQGGTLWAVHTVKTLPSFNFGRVAILGDAAHAMMPFQGAGAGQSVEVSCARLHSQLTCCVDLI